MESVWPGPLERQSQSDAAGQSWVAVQAERGKISLFQLVPIAAEVAAAALLETWQHLAVGVPDGRT